MNIGRKIYFDKETGNVLIDTGERSGSVIETTQEQDFASYAVLSERVPSSVGVLSLTYGQDREKFGFYAYHIDPVTETVVWDLTPIQQEEVERQLTLEEKQAELDNRVSATENAILAIMDMSLI